MRLIVPDEPVKERWDWFVILLVLYNAVEVPFDLAFEPDAVVGLVVWDYLVDVCFMVDMVVSFRTTYYNASRQV